VDRHKKPTDLLLVFFVLSVKSSQCSGIYIYIYIHTHTHTYTISSVRYEIHKMVTHGSCSLNRRVSGTYTVKMRLCTPTARVVIMIYMTNRVCSLTIQQHCMYHSVISLMNCSLLHYHPISKTNKLHYKASTSAIRDHSQWTGKF
jgi:hypothetical protein